MSLLRLSRFRWLILSLIGPALLTLASCAQSPETRKHAALSHGEQYAKDGKLGEAIIEFKTALEIDESFGLATYALGRAYAARFWYVDAAKELAQAQTLSPDSPAI